MLKLGDIYFNGVDVEQDYLEAKKYYEILASSNNAQEILNLGNMYFNGIGVRQNYIIAKEYFEKACNLNEPVGFY